MPPKPWKAPSQVLISLNGLMEKKQIQLRKIWDNFS